MGQLHASPQTAISNRSRSTYKPQALSAIPLRFSLISEYQLHEPAGFERGDSTCDRLARDLGNDNEICARKIPVAGNLIINILGKPGRVIESDISTPMVGADPHS